MYRRDYIQRVLEEFGRVMSHVASKKMMEFHEEALDELRDAYKTYFGIEADELEKIAPEDFVKTITEKYDFKNEQLDALARALRMESELYPLNQVKTVDCKMKALSLFRHLEVMDKGTFSTSRKEAIQQLENELNT